MVFRGEKMSSKYFMVPLLLLFSTGIDGRKRLLYLVWRPSPSDSDELVDERDIASSSVDEEGRVPLLLGEGQLELGKNIAAKRCIVSARSSLSV